MPFCANLRPSWLRRHRRTSYQSDVLIHPALPGPVRRGIALGLAQAGAAVAILARNEEKNQRVIGEIQGLGVAAYSFFVPKTGRESIVSEASPLCLLGVIAESVPKLTLSGIEELKARISQRPKPILELLGRPDVVAIRAARKKWR